VKQAVAVAKKQVLKKCVMYGVDFEQMDEWVAEWPLGLLVQMLLRGAHLYWAEPPVRYP
jgi:hypothetical protein